MKLPLFRFNGTALCEGDFQFSEALMLLLAKSAAEVSVSEKGF